MPETRSLTVSAQEGAGHRLDQAVAALSGLTRSRALELIAEGLVTVNARPSKPGYKLRPLDQVLVTMPASRGPEQEGLLPEDLPLKVLYSDDDLVVIDKPAGMVVYPAAGHARGTLMNALRYKFGPLVAVGGPLRPGVVHRLDKDTSGVMVVALSDRAYYDLVEQFRERSIERLYKAIVYGTLKTGKGVIEASIGRSINDRKKMSAKSFAGKGKEAVTRWEVVTRLKGATLIKAKLGTGRTHQIRVHFTHIGHPLLGDRTYGGKLNINLGGLRRDVPRQMLHAETLGFRHPATGEEMSFISPMPEDMREMVKLLSLSP